MGLFGETLKAFEKQYRNKHSHNTTSQMSPQLHLRNVQFNVDWKSISRRRKDNHERDKTVLDTLVGRNSIKTYLCMIKCNI